ncbi:hypothetical protein CR203_10365 [Salipaludibacillus neizhouensis]|uniref:Uncharacterized protein n=1 Tax=Salipaludibacillus neizhouensis TaxID=885475 RepID=A0A3A9KAG7_9BACI|nr:DUF3603 family protein [Salipaludibacillus neizhouensis]RKL67740.1 hypothetical protein CR203_10365 [Salipaludibacillus neizhouensis]
MIHMRDVWVNWFEGEENSYNVSEFFEWKKHDRIELIDQIVVVKVHSNLIEYIENTLQELPEGLLSDVYKQSYLRQKSERKPTEYCFIATDGSRAIIVDTIGYHTPIRKSRMVPRQEEQLRLLVEDLPFQDYHMDYLDCEKEYHLLSPEPQLMNGLVRREKQLKQLLFMALDQLYEEAELAELRYWYTEWIPAKYADIQLMGFDDVWTSLFNDVKSGWSPRHEEFCHALIKGQPFFEKLWALQNEEETTKKMKNKSI